MRYLEWLFPINRYVRLRSKPGAARLIATLVAAFLIVWVAVGVSMGLGSSAHIDTRRKIVFGLRESVEPLVVFLGRQPQGMDSESMVIRLALIGGSTGVLFLAYGLARLRLWRLRRRGVACEGSPGTYVLLGAQSLAIYWVVWGAWLTALDHHIDTYWLWELTGVYVRIDPVAVYFVRLCVPLGAIVLVTGWQAASAVKAICAAPPHLR